MPMRNSNKMFPGHPFRILCLLKEVDLCWWHLSVLYSYLTKRPAASVGVAVYGLNIVVCDL